MKNWLKFIGLSFFSDDIAKSAAKRGLGNILFAALLTVVFLLLGTIFATVLTFETNYNNTPELSATVEAAVSSPDITLEVKDGRLSASAIIDTIGNEADKDKYSRGYDLILDTRDANTFDDFTAYCETQSGKRITYEEYTELDADVKTLYTFGIEYSGVERVIDDEWVNRCETYLDSVESKAVADEYAEVKKLDGSEYRSALYNLYVKAYYPDLSAYETGGNAPKTRNYYYYKYGSRGNTLFLFNDSAIGTYKTKFGASHTLYGNYSEVPDGEVGKSAADADEFIFDCVDGATAVVVYNCVMNFFLLVPFTVVIVIAVSVLMFCMRKLLKLDEIKFGAAAKIVCSFLIFSSLISAIVTFCLGYLVSESLIYWLSGLTLFVVLLIRTAVMLIRDRMAMRREESRAESADAEEHGETSERKENIESAVKAEESVVERSES